MPHLASYGSDLLGLAIATGDMRIAEYLSERMPPSDKWSPGARRVLDQAIAGSNHAAVRLLLKKHAGPPTMGNSNVPLLAYSIAKEDTKLFEELLTCGADPNTTLPNRPSQDFLSQLKSRRLRYYLEGEKGVTVLMLAAGTGNTEFVRALLDAGADRKRATKRYKMLPLYLAAQSGHWRCAQLLLGSGPPPDQLRVEISLSSQKVALIKDGVPVFNTTCSTGRGGRYATRAGDYVITDKDRYHVSTIYHVRHAVFHAAELPRFRNARRLCAELSRVARLHSFAGRYRAQVLRRTPDRHAGHRAVSQHAIASFDRCRRSSAQRTCECVH